MSSEALQAAKVYRLLLKAVKKNIEKEDSKKHFKDYVTQEFRKNCSLSASVSVQEKIKLASDYTFMLNSVHHHKVIYRCVHFLRAWRVLQKSGSIVILEENCKRLEAWLRDLLFSYNIAVDRSDEVKRILGKSAASVGLRLPEVYQP